MLNTEMIQYQFKCLPLHCHYHPRLYSTKPSKFKKLCQTQQVAFRIFQPTPVLIGWYQCYTVAKCLILPFSLFTS